MPSLERRNPQVHCVRPFENWTEVLGNEHTLETSYCGRGVR